MGRGHRWWWGLQRREPSLTVSISYLDQGVNLLLLGEVFFCSLWPLLRALSSPAINAAERAESRNLVLDFCLKLQLCLLLPVDFKDKISEPLDLLFWFMTRSYNAAVRIGHCEAFGQSTKDPFWPTGSALEHTGNAREHQLLG